MKTILKQRCGNSRHLTKLQQIKRRTNKNPRNYVSFKRDQNAQPAFVDKVTLQMIIELKLPSAVLAFCFRNFAAAVNIPSISQVI